MPRSRLIALFLLLLGSVSVPQSGWCEEATTDTEVKQRMQAGIKEYGRNHLEAARAAFDSAWQLKHHSAIAASLADVEMKLGRYREAAEHWEYYLANSPPDRTDAEAELAACAQHLGRIRLSVEPPAAEILVDGKIAERLTPTASVWLLPGEHVLFARFEDRLSPAQTIALDAGGHTALVLTVAPRVVPVIPTPNLPAAPTSHPLEVAPHASSSVRAERGHGNTARTWTLLGGSIAAAAALGVGIGYSLSANSLADDATRLRFQTAQEGDPDLVKYGGQCAPPPGTPAPAACATLRATVNQMVEDQNIALGAYIASGVLTAATVVAFFVWPRDRSEASARLHWMVAPGSREASLRVFGEF
ncbi:MAG TPA: tetratricopeptide repeat protein [Polyangiaceae bacterium]|nr:tetratricopeptide repeat protein [Polyangiaceae bacterium]